MAESTTYLGILVIPVLLAFIASFGFGIVMIIGGLKMMRLQSHGWATTASILALLPCSPVGILGLVVGIWSLVVLSRRDVKEAFQASSRLPAHSFRTGSRTRGWAWLILAAITMVPLVIVLFFFGSRAISRGDRDGVLQIDCTTEIKDAVILVQRDGRQVTLIDVESRPWARLKPGVYQLRLQSGSVRENSGMPPGEMSLSASSVTISAGTSRLVTLAVLRRPSEKTKALLHGTPVVDQKPSTGWIMGPKGPNLTNQAVRWLNLTPEQVGEVDKILQASHQEFLTLEAKYTERKTDEAGHVVITIKEFPAEVAKLEDQLWSQLDKILNTQQQSVARLNLKLDSPDLQVGMTISDTVTPGFFGWGKYGARIELWRVGSWSHWRVQTRGNVDSSRAPQLPEEYRRFWIEPAGTSAPPMKAAD